VSEENYLSDLNADQTDNFPLTLYFQPEDGRIRPKHVVGKFIVFTNIVVFFTAIVDY